MTNAVRIALIGCGRIAQVAHLPAIEKAWLYRLFVLLLAAVFIGILGLAVDAQRSASAGAVQVMVYLGPAAVASVARLAYEGSRGLRRRAAEPCEPA